jgi:GNAT superfamily N-acetyltransferase
MMRLVQADASTDFEAVLGLIRASFAYMESRIDPPSSMHRLTAASLADHAQEHELWLIQDGDDLCACVQFTRRPKCLYVGKLAVSANYRRRGLAARLMQHAEDRARVLALPALELQTRVELTENHATFAALGFVKTGESAHSGYNRPTSITMRKYL